MDEETFYCEKCGDEFTEEEGQFDSDGYCITCAEAESAEPEIEAEEPDDWDDIDENMDANDHLDWQADCAGVNDEY
jgi:hypothetical protein